jgi:hypothetical protein
MVQLEQGGVSNKVALHRHVFPFSLPGVGLQKSSGGGAASVATGDEEIMSEC